jgi:hypothetical protein
MYVCMSVYVYNMAMSFCKLKTLAIPCQLKDKSFIKINSTKTSNISIELNRKDLQVS